ncbi:MAG: SGNH/GDSL hydrolase family protein [Euzebya sp.]
MLIVLALFAAVTVGTIVALIAAPIAGIAVAVLFLACGVIAQRSAGPPRRAIGILLLLALLVGGTYGSVVALEVIEALRGADVPAEAADADALAAAEAKLGALGENGAFRVELTEPEVQAVVQAGIAADPTLPIRRIELDLRGATMDIAYRASFKSGSVQATGTATVAARDQGIALAIGPVSVGNIALPGVATASIGSLFSAITELNTALARQGAIVQAVEVGDTSLVIIGTKTGEPLTGGHLLDSIRSQSGAPQSSVSVPVETLGPGTVNGLEASGTPMVLALGDSLAANVGVTEPRDGYVSRFHRAIGQHDGTEYGMQNLGVTGETSSSLLLGGQLDRAELALQQRPAAYITIDIGANDLLGHLQSTDCSEDLRAPACQDRVDRSLTAYEGNVSAALQRVTAMSGQARVVLLQIYNPFSLGLGGSEQESESSAILSRLNTIAAQAATRNGVTIADGFSPLQNTTAATTHILDAQPDIHPNALGYDVLAQAIFLAVTG